VIKPQSGSLAAGVTVKVTGGAQSYAGTELADDFAQKYDTLPDGASISADTNTVVLSPGEEQIVNLTLSNGQTGTATCTSNNASVIHVNSPVTFTNGNAQISLTALTAGDAVITVRLDNSDTSAVISASSVLDKTDFDATQPRTMNFASGTQRIKTGETLKVTPEIYPLEARSQTISWESGNKKIATVAEDGTITAIAVGQTEINATCGDKRASFILVVSQGSGGISVGVQSIALNRTDITLLAGTSENLTSVITPANATNKIVSWDTSNASVATVKDGKVTAVSAGQATITVKTADGGKTAACHVTVTQPDTSWSVRYMTQIENEGWESDYKQDGDISGTMGQSLRLETIKLKVNNEALGSGDIEYKTHIQDIGWEQDYAKNDGQSGTVGQAKRLEAIQIRLTGDLEKNYDIYYCVHAQNVGWMAWAKNGESAGTAGYSYRLEGIRIQLVKKGEAPKNYETQTKDAFRDKDAQLAVSYRTHVQDFGWQGFVENGGVSGTVGQAKRLEGIEISLKNVNHTGYTGGISYQTHIENIGWNQGYKSDGDMAGTSHQSLRLEAIKIKLTGEMAEHYDVYYQVHAENFGWLAMAKNDEMSGTAGYAYRLEGIRIILVEKGGAAPAGVAGTQAKAFYQK